MRALVQRTGPAAVSVGGEPVDAIDAGLLVYVGISTQDTPADAEVLARKVANLRIFDDEQGKLNRSVLQAGGQVLVIPNFTLLADARKGRRPAFSAAATGSAAGPLQDAFCRAMEQEGCSVRRGVFGADMTIRSDARGPVNVIVDVPPGKA
jgi:D-tyrosyl-tRNA(Tyr) deacylase